MSLEIAPVPTVDDVCPEDFKAFVGSFPTGVTVVTWQDSDGEPGGMTVNAFASISVDPPLVMVSLSEGSRAVEPVLRSGVFGINILGATGDRAALAFARRDTAVLRDFEWSPGLLGNPLLTSDAVAVAECEVEKTVVAGDHTMVLGRVRQASHEPTAPLGYLRRRFAPWA
jgi:flavin reductase (DIM6/NTAB) family NADH-FMN oxidoreductase RutF